MMAGNLPPGVNLSDLPGNRPEDVIYDRLLEGPIGDALQNLAETYRWAGDIGSDGRQVFPAIDLESAERLIASLVDQVASWTRPGAQVMEPE